jgi:segregation and condensation protein A
MARAGRQVPRTVGLEPHFADLLPEVVLGLGPDAFAALAAKALTPRVEPEVSVSHLHVPLVSVREQAAIIVGRLRRQGTSTFRALVSDATTTMVVIGRFLALLELFREGSVSFEQVAPLGDLTIRWTGSDDGEIDVSDEYDDYDDEAVAEGDEADDIITAETEEIVE